MSSFPFNIFPGAGGNWQTIDTRWWSPTVSVNFAGNPAVEREVTEDVASYGKQIGWLNDVVLALVNLQGRENVERDAAARDSLKKLLEARVKIDAIKKSRKDTAWTNARAALANLANSDKSAYAVLVQSLSPDQPPTVS